MIEHSIAVFSAKTIRSLSGLKMPTPGETLESRDEGVCARLVSLSSGLRSV